MLFNFSTKNSYEWCGDFNNYYLLLLLLLLLFLFLILFHYLRFFMKCWSKFDKNMVTLRFKDLHIVH